MGGRGLIAVAGAPVVGNAQQASVESAGAASAQPPAATIDKAVCLGCHGNQGFSAPGANGRARSLHVAGEKFGKSVHGKRQCVECHKDITAIPHEKTGPLKVGCVQCHQDLWEAAKKENKDQEFARLGVVVDQIDHYMKSIHARPNREDQSRNDERATTATTRTTSIRPAAPSVRNGGCDAGLAGAGHADGVRARQPAAGQRRTAAERDGDAAGRGSAALARPGCGSRAPTRWRSR